jgi:hypothetical protein
MSRRNLWPSVFSESSSPKDEDCWLFRKFYKCTGSASESGDFKVLKSNFKLNAIHGHATWQHHSPSPLTQKIPKKKKKTRLPNRPIHWRTLYMLPYPKQNFI